MTQSSGNLTTPLYPHHEQAGAQIVEFAGWLMPMHFGSQINEHHAVRQDVGIFDVSHMAITDIVGENAYTFLRYLLANDVAKLQNPGKALYSCMLNETGGILDDLLVYYLQPHYYRLVTNAGTKNKIQNWLTKQNQQFSAEIHPRDDLAIIAVQGPQSPQKLNNVLSVYQQTLQALPAFNSTEISNMTLSRTGYTGEDGYEIMLAHDKASELWQQLLRADCQPAGLGARDTLRLEAGLNLYGEDMDEQSYPMECNLGWTIAWEPKEREFIGRQALEAAYGTTYYRTRGLMLESGGILRAKQKVITADGAEGLITSGSYAPSLHCSVALAKIPKKCQLPLTVQLRNRQLAVKTVKPPFVRNGKPTYKELNHG